MSPTHRWMWTSLIVALATGASVGVLADRVVSREANPAASSDRPSGTVWFECDETDEAPNGHDAGRKQWLERLGRELELDESQEALIQASFAEHGERAREFWERTRSEYCEMRDSLRSDVRSILTDEQIEKLEERFARHRQKRGAAEATGSAGVEKP